MLLKAKDARLRNKSVKRKVELMSSKTLTKIQADFPQVKRIVDATQSLNITVLKQDAAKGRKKDPAGCALAQACVRQKIADVAIIGIGTSYLIKGDTVTRYKTSQSVAREIVAYDRNAEFAEGGDYKLSKVCPSARLGTYHPDKNTGRKHPHQGAQPSKRIHHTENVRIVYRSNKNK